MKSLRMIVGSIAGLWRYPVKSLAAEPLANVEVEPDGIAGDRRTALVVNDAAHARDGKPYRGKEHALLHTVDSIEAARRLGTDAGTELDVVAGARYFDAQPISLLWDSWLRDVEALVRRPLEPLRYRPNIYVAGAAEFTAREAALVGTTLGLGSAVTLRVVATIKRCVTTTYDLATGASDPAVLREVAQRRQNTVGIYCIVVRPGRIAHGDVVIQ